MKKTKHKKEFTEELSDVCKYLINKHKSEPEEVEARNELYMLLKDWMDIWIKSILCNWHRTERPENILALSWDAFYFSLEYYKFGNAVHSHFFNYTRYYLLTYYAKKDSVHISLEELKDVLVLVPSTHQDKFEKMLKFFQLTQIIPEEHRMIWNDALESLYLSNSEGVWNWNKDMPFSQKTYFELKRSFKKIIKFILK